MSFCRKLLHILLFLFLSLYVYGYPRIQILSPNDVLFVQQQSSVAAYFQNRLQNTEEIPLQLYEYAITPQDTLLRISSRLQLPYATIASFNSIAQMHEPIRDKVMVIPNKPGIFIPETKRTVLHQLVVKRLNNTNAQGEAISITIEDSIVQGVFYEGVNLTAYERSQFLRSLFQFPLTIMRLTSPFGIRTHPIAGYRHHHDGIDLGAPVGTPVYSARIGTVASITSDPSLGLMLTIEHGFGYRSRYAHLSETFVAVGDAVNTNLIIATVGNSGVSTGPHLHFEILKDEVVIDPLSVLPKYGITQ